MRQQFINAISGPSPSGGYSQAIEITEASRTLFISGQIPVDSSGNVPSDFDGQARAAWRNIESQLLAANMKLENIVKHTTYLASKNYRDENSRIRQEILGTHTPALTVVIAEIYDEAWLLEIEAVAMA